MYVETIVDWYAYLRYVREKILKQEKKVALT